MRAKCTMQSCWLDKDAACVHFTMRAWPVARSIFDAPLRASLCERSERADNKLDISVHCAPALKCLAGGGIGLEKAGGIFLKRD